MLVALFVLVLVSVISVVVLVVVVVVVACQKVAWTTTPDAVVTSAAVNRGHHRVFCLLVCHLGVGCGNSTKLLPIQKSEFISEHILTIMSHGP